MGVGLAEGLGFGLGFGLGLGLCLGLGARTLLGRWARPEVALGIDQPSACGSGDGNGAVLRGCGVAWVRWSGGVGALWWRAPRHRGNRLRLGETAQVALARLAGGSRRTTVADRRLTSARGSRSVLLVAARLRHAPLRSAPAIAATTLLDQTVVPSAVLAKVTSSGNNERTDSASPTTTTR